MQCTASKRLQSEGGVHDMIYGRLDWKWDPPHHHHQHIHVHEHTHTFSVIAVLQWSIAEGSSLSLFSRFISWHAASDFMISVFVRARLNGTERHSTALLQSKSIYHKISQQMVQIWKKDGLIPDDVVEASKPADVGAPRMLIMWTGGMFLNYNTIFYTNRPVCSQHISSVLLPQPGGWFTVLFVCVIVEFLQC